MSGVVPSPDPSPKPLPKLGSYQLTRQLGSGGMSNVFHAVHEATGSVVAVKVLPRNLAKNVTLLQRFIREAKSAEALDHPHIVSIYDRGFDQGRHYLVLEFVEGRDLHDRVRLNGPLGIDEATGLIREVAEGLQYAAGRGMIHRDIKPANLLVTPEGHAKIIDLGLALQTEDEDERVTRDGTTVGTVDYMAPEQARDSRKTSERSDIYSLGCTFHYLLTGSPPYPGGGLADKLARHFTAPIPNVRARRPEVPERLALLIARMMAKKPERRFADYTELIAALDASNDPESRQPSAVPLDVLIDDDDEDDAPSGQATATEGRGGDRSNEPTAAYLTAEIIDDDDEPEPAAGVSLADLAALDDPESRPTARKPAPARPSPVKPTLAGPSLDAMFDEADELVEGVEPPSRGRGGELPIQTWIAAGVGVGLAIAMVAFGVSFVLSMARTDEPVAVKPIEPSPPPEEPAPAVDVPRPPRRPDRPGPIRPAPKKKAADPVLKPPEAIEVVKRPPAVEKAYPKEWEARWLPGSPPAEMIGADRTRIVLRRDADPGVEGQATSPAFAFGRARDVVEFADSGPFFEDDFQVAGKSRLIRARQGFRPILKVEPTSQTAVRDQEAKFVLGDPKAETLVIEGIDLAVDVRDLPQQQSTLFACRGADLTLRDCSITIANAGDRKFSVFRLAEGNKPNRLILDRCLIRGPIRTLIELTSARAEIILDRTMVLGEAGPLIAVEPADRAVRGLAMARSVIVTRGPLVDWGGKPAPMVVKSLGSTFARIEGAGVAGLFHFRAPPPGEPATWLDWSGEDNAFIGWPAWLVSGPESTIRLANLDAARSAWPSTDTTSRESPGAWPASTIGEEIGPAAMVARLPDRAGTLAKMASPRPTLRALTVESLKRLPTPELAEGMIGTTPIAPRVPPAGRPGGGAASIRVVEDLPVVANRERPPTPASPTDLIFDVQAAPWQGDLGRFLAEKITAPMSRAVVRVRGGGSHYTTPVRLPDGASVAILGDRALMSTFVTTPESKGRTMFDLRGGDLALADLGFASESNGRPGHWVRVEEGILGVRHCRFRDIGGPDPTLGAAIAFVAPGPTPMDPPRSGPLVAATDRPTARLRDTLIWTGGDAIAAHLGRGVVALENCLVISGGPAVRLSPQKVARDAFEADLILERCTVADDRNAVELGPWPGDPSGPDRPWLVSTRSCVFPKTQVGGPGALLLVDPEAFARGALTWDSRNDAYEVARFLAPLGPSPPAAPPTADLQKQWIDLWGSNHARLDAGPSPRKTDHVLRYKDKERPRPGKVTPLALELDPKVSGNKELGVDFKELPAPPAR